MPAPALQLRHRRLGLRDGILRQDEHPHPASPTPPSSLRTRLWRGFGQCEWDGRPSSPWRLVRYVLTGNRYGIVPASNLTREAVEMGLN